MNVLAVGAHPDDIELGCFGVLTTHHQRGDNIIGVVITNGALSSSPETRLKESESAAKLIKMKLLYGDFPDGNLKEDSSIVTFLDEIIKERNVDIMYTHSAHDRHQDHRVVAKASLSASRYLKELYAYETPSVMYPFNPQLFIDVTETFKTKIAAIKIHESQNDKTYMHIGAVEGLAKFRALQCGLYNRLCEAFEVQKILKN